jgi:hypothetical protein
MGNTVSSMNMRANGRNAGSRQKRDKLEDCAKWERSIEEWSEWKGSVYDGELNDVIQLGR